MNKLNELRTHLLSLHHLNLKPDNLHTFIDEPGQVTSHANVLKNTGFGANLPQPAAPSAQPANQNFKMAYTASLVITDYADDFNVLAYELIQWLDTYEPERGETALTFQADILKVDLVDLQIQIKLTEVVTVTNANNGVSISAHNCKRPVL